MLSSLRFFFFAHFHKRYVLLISNPSNRMKFEALITNLPEKERCEKRADRIACLINFKTGHKWKQSLWAKRLTTLYPSISWKVFFEDSAQSMPTYFLNINEVHDIIAGFHFITIPIQYKLFNRSVSYFQTTITITAVYVIHKFRSCIRAANGNEQLAHSWLDWSIDRAVQVRVWVPLHSFLATA